MNQPSHNRRPARSLRRLLGVGGLFALVCVLAAGTWFAFGRGDSDRSNLSEAPEFVAKKAAAAETPATSEKKSPPADGAVAEETPAKQTPAETKKGAPDDVAPYGLPLNVVFENVPATPEKLTKATPLSAISDK